MRRGDVFWVDLGDPIGSEPGYIRPVLVIQSDAINGSKLATTIVLSLTSNLEYRKMPGCVFIAKGESNLPKDSIANITQIRTIDKSRIGELIGRVNDATMFIIDNELRHVLSL